MALDDFTGADVARGGGDGPANVGCGEISGEFQRVGEETVAGQHSNRVTPFAGKGGEAAEVCRWVGSGSEILTVAKYGK